MRSIGCPKEHWQVFWMSAVVKLTADGSYRREIVSDILPAPVPNDAGGSFPSLINPEAARCVHMVLQNLTLGFVKYHLRPET